MKISTGIEMLEIERKNFMGQDMIIHPTLIWDHEIAVLVDTGFIDQKSVFLDQFEKTNVPFELLRKIILTHHHFDHIGSISDLLAESSHDIEVLASELERPFIQGEKSLLTDELVSQIDTWPEQMRNQFLSELSGTTKVNVNKIVMDGEELPYCGGIIVIHTPGHSRGHISLYHKQSNTLIAADAMVVQDGQLELNPQCSDIELAQKSLSKFTQYDIEAVICYHGGLFKEKINERIVKLLKNV
ncbi:MBL fold metallo-hydrolase [Chengkuizengella axinellae]|uniref:MBL fold metallo-hydrolase n=1 Tax=Chengkuizengella axinellae TaxID=3064388 RepID=A0ABT9IVV2_9BACL|nr:MBL fold metallo-hydrolase [Chengkuizengella sp. 2205SS18-9]MDP5272939.1 MBL fold metallo-hydrolase [Chengkuizengella sp. 2205SS18-9]